MPKGLFERDRVEIGFDRETLEVLRSLAPQINQVETIRNIVSEEIKNALREANENLKEASLELTSLAERAAAKPAVQEDDELKAIVGEIVNRSRGLRDIVPNAVADNTPPPAEPKPEEPADPAEPAEGQPA